MSSLGRYIKVHTSVHSNADFRRLSAPKPCGQSCWDYIQHGPRVTQIPGLITGTMKSMAGDLGWGPKPFLRCLQEVEDIGWVEVDHEAGVIWSERIMQTNYPTSPNQVSSWWSVFGELPESHLVLRVLRKWRAWCAERDEKRPPEAPPTDEKARKKKKGKSSSWLASFDGAFRRFAECGLEEWAAEVTARLDHAKAADRLSVSGAVQSAVCDGELNADLDGVRDAVSDAVPDAVRNAIQVGDSDAVSDLKSKSHSKSITPSSEGDSASSGRDASPSSEEDGETPPADGKLFPDGEPEQAEEPKRKPPKPRPTLATLRSSPDLTEGDTLVASARRLFMAWAEAKGSAANTVFDSGREALIKKRLDEGFTEERLRRALEAVAVPSWHREHDATDLSIVLKSAKNIEKFEGYARHGDRTRGANRTAGEERDRRTRTAAAAVITTPVFRKPPRDPMESSIDYEKRCEEAEYAHMLDEMEARNAEAQPELTEAHS